MKKRFTKLQHALATKVWLQNVVAWVVFSLVFAITAQFDGEEGIVERCIVIMSLVAMLAIPVYVTNLLLLPLFRRKRYLLALVGYASLLVFFAFLGDWVVYYVYRFGCLFTACMEDFVDFGIGKRSNLLGTTLLSTLIGLSLRIARDNVVEKSRNQEAKLQLLKAQLNPHFLFNTLNNLYGLAVVKSDKLPGLMLQLSDLLRYSLYQTKDAQVPLAQEITYLQNYVELERLRLEDEIELPLVLNGTPAGQQIAPMLLIVFLENAFKHFGAQQGTALFIRTSLDISEQQLHFRCTNSKDPQAIESPRQQNTSGIGLVNVRQRLALLYPGQHQLEVRDEGTSFSVSLVINL